MGEKLTPYFAEAEKLMGLKGRIKLAMLTKLSATGAAAAPDTAENIRLFDSAITDIKSSVGLDAHASR
jgi:hypothetical protein